MPKPRAPSSPEKLWKIEFATVSFYITTEGHMFQPLSFVLQTPGTF